MIRRSVVACAIAVVGCVQEPTLAFEDKGRGTWVEIEGAPALGYRALWASPDHQVVAVGNAGIAVWEAVDAARWHGWPTLPAMRSISGGARFWAGASRDTLLVKREDADQPEIRPDNRAVLSPRDVRGIHAASADRLLLVGDPVILEAPDPVSGVTSSPVEACDDAGCALEQVLPAARISRFNAVVGTHDRTAFAVSDDAVFRRWAKP
jgi:hypothetical protein